MRDSLTYFKYLVGLKRMRGKVHNDVEETNCKHRIKNAEAVKSDRTFTVRTSLFFLSFSGFMLPALLRSLASFVPPSGIQPKTSYEPQKSDLRFFCMDFTWIFVCTFSSCEVTSGWR